MINLDKGQQDIYSDLLEELVEEDHLLCKVLELIDFTSLCKDLHDCYCENNGTPGLEIERGFKAAFLQQFEDISDRKMAKHLKENLSAKLLLTTTQRSRCCQKQFSFLRFNCRN